LKRAAILAGFRRKPTPLETILKLLLQLTSADCDHLRASSVNNR
jgi:hypothetical protein